MEIVDARGKTLIVGGGLAGLTAALCLAPKPVILLSKAPLGQEASSALAQGGIAGRNPRTPPVVLWTAVSLP